MRTILRIKFGSHLYGTATPESDLDYKSVYVPSAQDILLQRVKGSISTQRPKGEGEKNYAGEVDEESYAVQRYLDLVAQGQTVALDVLFAPESVMLEPPAPEWRIITENRHKLVTRKAAAFVGYCRQQANKYGIRGSRIAAAKAAKGFLESAAEQHGTQAKVAEFGKEIAGIADRTEHMAIIDITQGSGETIRHWEVCGRKLQFTSTVKYALDIVQRLLDEYGHRALLAERNEGIDWKALSHAVRVGHQAIELLETGAFTFPLPNAQHILAIKRGELPYKQVAEEIEQLLADVEIASERSTLPAEPDRDWIDAFVAECHRKQIVPA